MDFPIDLKTGKWVYGVEEVKQLIDVLLKNPLGTFLQSNNIGSYVSVHSSNEMELQENIKATLLQVPGIRVKEITIKGNVADVQIEYSAHEINYQYSIVL